MSAPRLEAQCVKHGTPLPWCDHCATTGVMAAWASAFSGDELAEALETLNWNDRYYTAPERQAILAEAGQRLRCKS